MPKFINIEQDSSEWHAFRRDHIGASDAAAIYCKCPYRTPLMVFDEKMGSSTLIDSSSIRLGKEREPQIRNRINDLLKTEYKSVVAESSDCGYLSASLDGFDEGCEDPILEIKVNNAENHSLAEEDLLPPHHLIQVQHQMYVMDRKSALYASWNEKLEQLKLVKVNFDWQSYRHCLSALHEFWRNKSNFISPEPTDRDLIKFQEQEHFDLAREYRETCESLRIMEEKKEALRVRLIQCGGGKSSMIGDLTVKKYVSQGHVDYSKIEALKEIDLNQYRKSSITSWRIC